MKKREAALKLQLMSEIALQLPGFVAMRHEDVRSSGHPDISLDGCARGSWWECKHGTPNFESHGIQELTMLRLAAANYARYIVWEERGGIRRTLIVHPRHIGVKDLSAYADAWWVGFDHKSTVAFMKQVHRA